MVVTEVLRPQPGERVLDLAASPGGKTTHIAACMQDRGLLIANEIRTKRIPALVTNMERWGVRNTIITNETPERLADRLPGFFDRVLVDAPCSGEGMFRKEPAASREWKEVALSGYSDRQRLILRFAARLVRPGGVLVYATCTFNTEENERLIGSFLEEHADFEADTLPSLSGVSSPISDGLSKSFQPERCCLRIWPHISHGEGHFAARLRRMDGVSNFARITPKRPAPSRQACEDFQEFMRSTLDLEIHVLDLALFGSYLYHMSSETPDLSGLRVPRPGWWLGKARKGRFEPSHALAMTLPAEKAGVRLDLPNRDARLQTYLRGELVNVDLPDGWVLVTVDGFPLGWGKAVQGVMKNHYPAGLRLV
jgi:NOL1/NOP2/fmu family ribosome biogenesis protein/23S rRNA U2552 (ribose-2'-O)-methylase RlmE/FtsJ